MDPKLVFWKEPKVVYEPHHAVLLPLVIERWLKPGRICSGTSWFVSQAGLHLARGDILKCAMPDQEGGWLCPLRSVTKQSVDGSVCQWSTDLHPNHRAKLAAWAPSHWPLRRLNGTLHAWTKAAAFWSSSMLAAYFHTRSGLAACHSAELWPLAIQRQRRPSFFQPEPAVWHLLPSCLTQQTG